MSTLLIFLAFVLRWLDVKVFMLVFSAMSISLTILMTISAFIQVTELIKNHKDDDSKR